MTAIETDRGTKALSSGRSAGRRGRILYLAGLALLVFAGFSLAITVLRAPARTAIIDLDGEAVTITVSMVPDPPKTGPIPIQITIRDKVGRAVAVDEVVVRYGMAEGMPAEAVATTIVPGLYAAQTAFPNVGKAWVEIAVRRGGARRLFRVPVDVRPNM